MDKNRAKAYQAAHLFLLNSIRTTGGSAAFYSRLLHPVNGWSEAYPETTGYLIPTLFEAGSSEEALLLADWVVSLQYEDGGLPGGLLKKGEKRERSIFNTAQMILGLHRAALETSDRKYIDATVKAGKWLANTQESDGTWNKYHYKSNYFPSYYTRVAWPMLLASEFDKSHEITNAAIKTLDFIQENALDNYFFIDAGFKKNAPAYLHTIAYTIRGFLESALLLNRSDYWDTGYNLAHHLFRQFELNNRLAGAYYQDGQRINWYRCLTGEAQMCIIWLLLAKHNEDYRFLNASSKLLDKLCLAQPSLSIFKKKGGLSGSKPFYGRYIAFRQPNWASKFFMDALLLEEQLYRYLESVRATGGTKK